MQATKGARPWDGPRLKLRLIGGCTAECGSAQLDLRKEKARAMLMLLAIQPGHRMARERLRGLLWSDSSEHAAQTSLRNAIWSLRNAMQPAGYRGFVSDRRDVWLVPGSFDTDINQLLDDPDPAALLHQLSLTPQPHATLGQGLESLGDLASQPLEEYRASVQRRVVQRLNGLRAATQTRPAKIEILSLLNGLDPLDETVVRDLIAAYRDDGQIANALAAYQSLWNELDATFGEEPSQETQDLIVEIKLRVAEPGQPAPPLDPRPVILLRTATPDATNEQRQQFLHELRQNLSASLVRFREWRVLDEDLVLQEVAAAPSVQSYALSLTLPAGSALACRLILSDRRSGELLWSDTLYDRFLDSEGADMIVRRLAASLNVHLAQHRLSHAQPGNDRSADAYDRWLNAQKLILQFSPESWKQAEDALDKLIDDNPNFSRAHSSRASIENMRHISFPGLYSNPDFHRVALDHAARAIALDPMDSRGQLAMGWSCAMSRQFDRAELAFELAFQYNENDPWTIASAAVGLAFCDHHEAAARLVRLLMSLGLRLEPQHWSYIAATRFLAGDYAGCIEASEKSAEISHDVPAWHAAALAQTGQRDKAREVARRFHEIALANWVLARPEDPAEVTRWLVSAFPIRNRDAWLALRDGLRAAGLPVPDLIQSSKSAIGYKLDLDA